MCNAKVTLDSLQPECGSVVGLETPNDARRPLGLQKDFENLTRLPFYKPLETVSCVPQGAGGNGQSVKKWLPNICCRHPEQECDTLHEELFLKARKCAAVTVGTGDSAREACVVTVV